MRRVVVREVPVTSQPTIEPQLLERLRGELRTRRTLADVLTWARAQQPPATVVEIVTQDEYTHDVIVALDPRVHLVFDAT